VTRKVIKPYADGHSGEGHLSRGHEKRRPIQKEREGRFKRFMKKIRCDV